MSTICKIDPRIRRERYDRRDTIRSLARVSQQLTGFQKLRAELVLTGLISIVKNSVTTGLSKLRAFARIIKQLEAT
jgi:hypothetical protein